MKHKCKDCAHFINTLKIQGCGLCYPPAKCSGNLEIDCEDFITPADEEKGKKSCGENINKKEGTKQ